VQVSLNQIEHTVRKAVRGAGLDWGLAEDAGRAVRWLETMDINGIGMLHDLMTQIDHSDVASLAVEPLADGWHSGHAGISPVLAGPSLGDQLYNLDAGICLHHVATPVLIAGFIGAVLGADEKSVCLRWNGFELEVSSNQLGLAGDAEQLYAQVTDGLLVISTNDNETTVFNYRTGKIQARTVGQQLWRALEALAHHTYVPATEASRLAGAGAGLSDND